jgi:flagellar hook-length control protein FliK
MARKFESGESRFEIRLDPAELGKLDISMTVSDDGHVQAVVRAERPETLDMLQRDARVLENQLRQSGLNVDSGSLNFSLGGGNNQRSAFSGAMQNFGATFDPTADTDTIASPTSTAILSVRDGVDIRI